MRLVLIDFILILLIGASVAVGLMRGIIREGLSVANWVAAFFVAAFFRPVLDVRLEGIINIAEIRSVSAFAGIFICSLLVGGIIIHLSHALVKASGLSGTDRSLGMAFGLLRGALAVVAIASVLNPLFAEESWWHGSQLLPFFLAFEAEVMVLGERFYCMVFGLILGSEFC